MTRPASNTLEQLGNRFYNGDGAVNHNGECIVNDRNTVRNANVNGMDINNGNNNANDNGTDINNGNNNNNNNIELNSMGYPKHFMVDKYGWYDLKAMKQNCTSEGHKLVKGICSPLQMLSSVTRRHPKSQGVLQHQLNEQVHELIELQIVQNSFDGSSAGMENTQLLSLIEINNKINKLQHIISGTVEIMQMACEISIDLDKDTRNYNEKEKQPEPKVITSVLEVGNELRQSNVPAIAFDTHEDGQLVAALRKIERHIGYKSIHRDRQVKWIMSCFEKSERYDIEEHVESFANETLKNTLALPTVSEVIDSIKLKFVSDVQPIYFLNLILKIVDFVIANKYRDTIYYEKLCEDLRKILQESEKAKDDNQKITIQLTQAAIVATMDNKLKQKFEHELKGIKHEKIPTTPREFLKTFKSFCRSEDVYSYENKSRGRQMERGRNDDYNDKSRSRSRGRYEAEGDRICVQWLKNDCKFGDKCKFLHRKDTRAKDSIHQSRMGDTKYRTPSRSPSRSNNSRVCYDFLKGQCKRGSQCNFEHKQQ